MKILLAPAEVKRLGGVGIEYCSDNFTFKDSQIIRDNIVKEYNSFIESSSLEELSNWFGLKDLNEVKRYKKSIYTQNSMKAINRYIGVAFDALEYDLLENSAKNYIDNSVVIFSNLFGILLAKDLIPNYKFKQGAKLNRIDVIKSYNSVIKDELDNFLGDEVVDLRAGFYDKFYRPKKAKVITFKFLKDGRVVSHYAKHYRGVLLKEMAKYNISNFKELRDMPIENLKLIDIEHKSNIEIFNMEIVG